ncbi:ElyC/SanA/YdcF family protein [Actinoplanes sp. L3-i22]|uniref:ElyC/SanA/YdcF family protein n=1 Tax=Actinoplanes sp. L3-i22 TaxID=2836373 RepID=UPI001C848B2B|nr:ElyC/SanA/YdcF family protein [Actinoplanes sp. L3-i22]
MDFETVAGTPGLTLDQVAHVLVPGRGRDAAGFDLTPAAAARVAVAAELFREVVGARGGRVVCTGYKSPADDKGTPWTTPEAPGETFRGRPEADAMRASLIASGLNPSSVRAERRSIDTVTNLVRAEGEFHFGDSRPVAIVSQRAHLHRILTIIAPRALLRPYVGVVVPDFDVDRENPLTLLVSRLVVTGLPRDPARAIAAADRRAALLWQLARLVGKRTYH